MSIDILKQRFERYRPATAEMERQVLRQILPELALSGLARAGLFGKAAFHGGTCLRILHGLRRFSEDLDFVLKRPDPDFAWRSFSKVLREELRLYGLDPEIRDRAEARPVRTVLLKDASMGEIPGSRNALQPGQNLTVKLEIDCNPPAGSGFEISYVNFPVPFSLLAQDLPSSFGSKLHALLCRTYTKGRDWFDLVWYADHGVEPNLPLLQNAIDQQGPWQGQRLLIDRDWLTEKLLKKIESTDWAEARADVERFVGEPERRGLDVWGQEFFRRQVESIIRP